jgi:serine/threonine protein kinase
MIWNSNEGCPDERVLKQSLFDADRTSVELIAHIEICSTCQIRLEAMTTGNSLAETRDDWQQYSSIQSNLSPPLRLNDLGAVGHFAVESVIGIGGMGIVYRGWDTLLNRAVAIKLVKPDQSEIANQRFRRECHALAQIEHDHIVPVYSTGPLPNGTSYLILPLMTGGSLSELLAERALSIREAAVIIRSIAEGLAAAHAAGLIHRDVKSPGFQRLAGESYGAERGCVPTIIRFWE